MARAPAPDYSSTANDTNFQKPNTYGFVSAKHNHEPPNNDDEIVNDEDIEEEEEQQEPFDPLLMLRANNPNYVPSTSPEQQQQQQQLRSSLLYRPQTRMGIFRQCLRKFFQYWFERVITCIGFFALAFATPFPTACSVLYSPLLTHYQTSHVLMGLTSGTLKCMHLLAGAFTLPLTRRFGHRKIGSIASLFGIIAFFLSYMADSWWVLLLCMAILGGTSVGIVRFTLLSGLNRLFSRNITSITYVYAAGIVGSVVLPIVFQAILIGLYQNGGNVGSDTAPWKNTVLAAGGISGIFLIASVLYNVEQHTLPTSVFAKHLARQQQQPGGAGEVTVNGNIATSANTLEQQQQLLALTKTPKSSKKSGRIMQRIRANKAKQGQPTGSLKGAGAGVCGACKEKQNCDDRIFAHSSFLSKCTQRTFFYHFCLTQNTVNCLLLLSDW